MTYLHAVEGDLPAGCLDARRSSEFGAGSGSCCSHACRFCAPSSDASARGCRLPPSARAPCPSRRPSRARGVRARLHDRTSRRRAPRVPARSTPCEARAAAAYAIAGASLGPESRSERPTLSSGALSRVTHEMHRQLSGGRERTHAQAERLARGVGESTSRPIASGRNTTCPSKRFSVRMRTLASRPLHTGGVA